MRFVSLLREAIVVAGERGIERMLGARVTEGVYLTDGGEAGLEAGGGGEAMSRIDGGLDDGRCSSADAYAESTSSSSSPAPSSSSSYRQLRTIGRSANLTELPVP